MILRKSSPQLYQEYVERMRRIGDIKNACALLQWDQETYLPPKGAQFRAQQIATLSEQAHRLFIRDEMGDNLQELIAREDLSADNARNVALTWEDYVKQRKFSSDFVRQMSQAISRSFHAWVHARKENSFQVFNSELDGLLDFKIQEANILGFSSHPYDALLDEFDKGWNVQLYDEVFVETLQPLKDLLGRILAKPEIDDAFLRQYFPRQQQWDFGMKIIGQLGFDFEAGRQDISEHPFTTNFNRYDVRITTRIDEYNFNNMLWSCIHETGHALYEQGLPENEYALPLGEYASIGIHESQSRLWENGVGRSRGFWDFHYGDLRQSFSEQFHLISSDQFYRAINKVKPSLIRTEADELTYHFHIIIRYNIERLLIDRTLSTADIPTYWNELYDKYLGLRVPDDRSGCLQDVHWSHGSFGYFPTYSLGSFYAAQLLAIATKAHPEISSGIEMGNNKLLLDYLRRHVFRYGRRYTSQELFRTIGGEALRPQYFLDYVYNKYKNIYNL